MRNMQLRARSPVRQGAANQAHVAGIVFYK